MALNGGYSIYPGNTMGYEAAPQSVMWKDSEWSYVWGNTVQMPFMGESRPQALVRLRNRSTGREVYWINAHLSPGKMQADRDKGMDIIKQVVKQLAGDGLPVLVTGDLNEHAKAFRRIACPTDLNAAGGRRDEGLHVPAAEGDAGRLDLRPRLLRHHRGQPGRPGAPYDGPRGGLLALHRAVVSRLPIRSSRAAGEESR